MTEFFLNIVNTSISAGWLILAVLILRPALKKAPKWVSVLLWGIVALRLVCPFSIESALSLIPSAETIPTEILTENSFDIQSGIAPVDDLVNDYLGDHYYEGVTVPVGNGLNVITLLAVLWCAGVLAMAAYTAVSCLRLYRRIRTAILLRENIYQSETVSSPFVFGLFRPRIYLPFRMDKTALRHVVAHESAHIRRHDHWWKPLGFLLLTIHWFNPLMWLGYILLCRDIELACDEKVIRELDGVEKANYSQVLLSCSIDRRMIAACPLAFGEVGIKERVKSVLSYKKPAFWIIVLSVVLCAALAVCFLTDPENIRETPFGRSYTIVEAIYVNPNHEIPDAKYSLSSDQIIFSCTDAENTDQWHYAGASTEIRLKRSIFDNYIYDAGDSSGWKTGFSAAKIRRDNDRAWRCIAEEGVSYYLLRQKNSDFYLAGLYYDKEGETDRSSDDSNIFYILKLKATPSLTCVAYSEGLDAHMVPSFYPDGFLFDDSRICSGEVNITGRLVLTPEWDTDTLTITEEYHMGYSNGHTDVQRETYTLRKRPDGTFELPVIRRGETEGNAYYLIEGEGGVYALKLHFPGAEEGSMMGYSLIIGAAGVKNVGIHTPYSSGGCINADNTPFRKGEKVYLSQLDGLSSLRGVSITADDESGNVLYSFSVPEGATDMEIAELVLNSPWTLECFTIPYVDDSGSEAPETDFAQPDPLESAIAGAVLTHFASDHPDGLIHVESHKLLACESASGTPLFGKDDHSVETTAYLLVLHQAYSTYGGTLKEQTGSYVPTAITFEVSETGKYALKEYWEPRDGGFYLKDLRDKFPGAAADDALNDQLYIEALQEECAQQALAIMEAYGSLDAQIATLLDTIQSSPATSSNPGDYISAHEAEFEELVSCGEYSLRYCFAQFLKGGESGLRGHIMASLCREIASEWGEAILMIDSDPPLTGQAWFDTFQTSAQQLSLQYSDEDLEKFYPASRLLLQMING